MDRTAPRWTLVLALWSGAVACGQPTHGSPPPPRLAPPAAPTTLATSHEEAARAAAPPSCVNDGTPYDLATLRTRLAALAGAGLDGRAPGTPGDDAARELIEQRFRCLGLVPAASETATKSTYVQPFTAEGKRSANVVGLVRGTDPDVGGEVILISAHHDHLGDGFLGANDNASGVVALLEIAQHVAQRASPPRRTIVFATFGDEERGMHGSYHFAANPPAEVPLDRVVQVVNLDMVGSYSSRGFVAAMGTFRGFPASQLLGKLRGHYPKLSVGMGGKARGSDFEPFCKLGVPYVFFWTPDARCYHERCDTLDRIDHPHMAQIATLAGELTDALADTAIDLAAARTKRGCGVKYAD